MKKLLSIGLSIIVLLVGAFFAVGVFVPNYRYSTRVEIDRPIDAAWDYFADETKAKDWIKGLQSMELIGGEPRTVGSKYRMEFEQDGRHMVMTETVTDYVPRERFAFILENEVIRSEATVKFTSINGRTLVEQDVDVRGGNPFWRSLFALMRSSFKSNAQEMLDTLKTNIEKS